MLTLCVGKLIKRNASCESSSASRLAAIAASTALWLGPPPFKGLK